MSAASAIQRATGYAEVIDAGSVNFKTADHAIPTLNATSNFASYGTVGYTLEQKLEVIRKVEI